MFFRKINLFAPSLKGACLAGQVGKLIFITPFRAGADDENQQPAKKKFLISVIFI
jgi:hypothetical protein